MKTLNGCECEHGDHFDESIQDAHLYGAEAPDGLRPGPGGLFYCRECADHEKSAARFYRAQEAK